MSKTLDGVVRSWSPGTERHFGFTAQEMIGQPILQIIPPELHAEESELLARLQQGERIECYETCRLTRDGKRIEVSLSLAPIQDDEGHIIGGVSIRHEIYMRRVAEAALREEAHALETLNRQSASAAVVAIAVTAYARPEDRQRSLLAGYQIHIAKPIEAREPIAGIASLLRLSR